MGAGGTPLARDSDLVLPGDMHTAILTGMKAISVSIPQAAEENGSTIPPTAGGFLTGTRQLHRSLTVRQLPMPSSRVRHSAAAPNKHRRTLPAPALTEPGVVPIPSSEVNRQQDAQLQRAI